MPLSENSAKIVERAESWLMVVGWIRDASGGCSSPLEAEDGGSGAAASSSLTTSEDSSEKLRWFDFLHEPAEGACLRFEMLLGGEMLILF